MPRPTGWRPSVSTTSTCSPMAAPTDTRLAASERAAALLRTLAVGPTGTSISTRSEPTAAFFDSTDATSWASLSRSKGRSTRINTSSAGLSRAEPPQAMQPPSRSTTRRMVASSSVTGASVSIVSAVPAGEVMARDEVLGMTTPQAATMGTTRSVVRLPGRPPTQCLSITGESGHLMRCPTSTIARVRATISASSSRPPAQAVTKAARCRSDRRPWPMSPISACMES